MPTHRLILAADKRTDAAGRDLPYGTHALVSIPFVSAFVLRSESKHAWWAPNFAGYEENLALAGVYTRAAADDEVAGDALGTTRALRLAEAITFPAGRTFDLNSAPYEAARPNVAGAIFDSAPAAPALSALSPHAKKVQDALGVLLSDDERAWLLSVVDSFRTPDFPRHLSHGVYSKLVAEGRTDA